jgi:hypothetical protein
MQSGAQGSISRAKKPSNYPRSALRRFPAMDYNSAALTAPVGWRVGSSQPRNVCFAPQVPVASCFFMVEPGMEPIGKAAG